MAAKSTRSHGEVRGRKTIRLDGEAHELLANSRRAGESFSAAIKRLSRSQPLLSSFAGAWKGVPKEGLDEIREAVATSRRKDRERTAYIDKLWEGR